ncbi:hypothetical protein QBC42DRAFT_311703 [Cladorrhinum samala]|uniref:GATA-type domain-containing protein n=1 Tax=Cladorrhinum samala TaxID=585594 RepID=A0AAV9HX70_9PEZI|nr:hypothetical protein QBC42DRAFT_311703 [Cladorrhinum samala]
MDNNPEQPMSKLMVLATVCYDALVEINAKKAASLEQEPARDPALGRTPLPTSSRVRREPVTTESPALPSTSTTASQNTAPQVSGRIPRPGRRARLRAAPAGPSSRSAAGARLTKTEREKEAARIRQQTGVARPGGPCARCRRASATRKWSWTECRVAVGNDGAAVGMTCARCKFYKESCGDAIVTKGPARRSAKETETDLAQESAPESNQPVPDQPEPPDKM